MIENCRKFFLVEISYQGKILTFYEEDLSDLTPPMLLLESFFRSTDT